MRALTFFFAALLQILSAFEAAARRDVEPDEQLHPTENIEIFFQAGLIGDNIANTLDLLHRKNAIKLYPLVVESGTNLSEIVATAYKLPRDLVTNRMETVLCSWNRHICSSLPDGKSKWSYATPTQEDLARLNSDGNRSNQESVCARGKLEPFVVCFPLANFSDDVILEDHEVRRNSSIGTFVIDVLQGCKRFDKSCIEFITWANGNDLWNSGSYDGSVTLPVRVVVMHLRLTSAVSTQDVVDMLRESSSVPSENVFVSTATGAPQPQAVDSNSSLQLVAAPIVKSPPGANVPVVQKEEDNVKYLSGMGYTPYVRDIIDGFLSNDFSVVAGIWDLYVDTHHCDFERAAVGGRPKRNAIAFWDVNRKDFGEEHSDRVPDAWKALADMQQNAQVACPNARSNYDKTVDHGTFLAGLIAAQPNGRGIIGVNPSAKIWAYHIWRFTNPVSEKRDASILPRLNSYGIPLPSVINISQDFRSSGPSDALKNALLSPVRSAKKSGAANRNVVIAAAGNLRTSPDDVADGEDCIVLPACWSRSNGTPNLHNGIISVVALDETGEWVLRCRDVLVKLDKAAGYRGCDSTHLDEPVSFHGKRYDVSAVGLATGPFFGNSFGFLAGTSVAAAYATALVSLIATKYTVEVGSPDMTMLRDRIRSTADPHPSSKYGRINFERALRFEIDQLWIRRGAVVEPLLGIMPRIDDLSFDWEGTTITTKARNLLRMTKISPNRWRVIVRTNNDKEKDIMLYEDVTEIRIKAFRFLAGPDSSDAGVVLEDVTDFISCSTECG